jgi:hypothetical protein
MHSTSATGRYASQTTCQGGGMAANATIIERLV